MESRSAEAGRRARVLLAVILALGLLVRAAHFAAIADSVLPGIQLAIPGSDTAAHWEWSGEILAGDWLGRETFHQYTPWMQELAPIETWYRWWGGEKVFNREPVYPYFLAVVRLLLAPFGGRDSVLAVLGVQLLLGALQPLVLFALGRRLLDERAGLLAATAGAVFGPFLFTQGTLLRDWIPPLLDPLLLLAILRARDRSRTLDWIVAGGLFGASVLVRSSILLFLPLALAWIAWEGRPGRLRAAAFLLVGLAIALSPLLARNVAVGAPLLAITNRAPETIVEANSVETTPVGMPIPPSMPAILEEARGSAWRAAVSTVQQYQGRWGAFARNQMLKLWGAFDPLEHSDNLDYGYGRAVSPVLRFAPGFALVGLFGAAGLLLAFRRGGVHRLVLLYVAATLAAQLLIVIVGRYRLGMAAALMALGADFALRTWDVLRGPSPRPALPSLLLLPLLLGAHFAFQPRELRDPAFRTSGRELEYGIAVELYTRDGRFEEALAEVRRFREHAQVGRTLAAQAGFLEGYLHCAWAEALRASGRTDRARDHAAAAEKAFDVPWQEASAWFRLGRLRIELGDPAEGKTFLERYLREDPRGPFAEDARRLLEASR